MHKKSKKLEHSGSGEDNKTDMPKVTETNKQGKTRLTKEGKELVFRATTMFRLWRQFLVYFGVIGFAYILADSFSRKLVYLILPFGIILAFLINKWMDKSNQKDLENYDPEGKELKMPKEWVEPTLVSEEEKYGNTNKTKK